MSTPPDAGRSATSPHVLHRLRLGKGAPSLVPAGATEAAEERFFTPAMGVAFGLYALFALTFSAFQIRGDGLVYFNLLR